MPRTLAFALALGLLAAACGDGTSNGTPDGGTSSGGGIQPTYSSLSEKLFVPTCSTNGCHDPGTKSGGLELTKANGYASLVNVKVASPEWAGTQWAGFNRVTPGQPDQSALVVTLEHPAGLDPALQMPPGLKLPQSTLTAVRQWITDGAKND